MDYRHGYGYHALRLETVRRTNTISYGVQFDGITDSIKVNDFLYQNNDYTIEFWIKDFGSQINSFNGYNFIYHGYFTRLAIFQNSYFDWVQFTPSPTLANDFMVPYAAIPGLNTSQWTHIVCRFSMATFKEEFFINGLPIQTTHLTKAPLGFANIFYIGSIGVGPFKRKLDEFRIYTRAISDIEIQHSYNGGNASLPADVGGLALWLGFENSMFNAGYLGIQQSGQASGFVGTPFVTR